MTDPTTIPGDDHDEALLRRVAEALGYDLVKAVSGDGDCGGHDPGRQLSNVLSLLKFEQVRMYRKGWQRIVDGETPVVQDLIFNEQEVIANLSDADVTPDFSVKGPKPHKLECTDSCSCSC